MACGPPPLGHVGVWEAPREGAGTTGTGPDPAVNQPGCVMWYAGGGTGLLHTALVPSWSPSSCWVAPARLWGHKPRLGDARNPEQLGCREGRSAVPGITQQPPRPRAGWAQSPRRVPAPPWGQGDASPTTQGITGCRKCLSGEFASTCGHAAWCGAPQPCAPAVRLSRLSCPLWGTGEPFAGAAR